MIERTFDLASFYAEMRATAKERAPLRQDLVRGLKDYFEARYGYDRYGAETIFHIGERLGEPYAYGYAALRILHDRRVSNQTKISVAQRALDITEYGTDSGLPYGFYAFLYFLAIRQQLSLQDLRYGLVVSAGEYNPFRGVEKRDFVGFFRWMLAQMVFPVEERLFWGHTLVARHGDHPGAAELINALLGAEHLPIEGRLELANAWINFRQPRLTVDIPDPGSSYREAFVADHLGFWVAHAPSWSSQHMVRLGLIWLARLGADPATLAVAYMSYRDTYAEHVHGAVAEILGEHHRRIPDNQLKTLIDKGIAMSGSVPTRRKFYRLGTELFGSEYLERATSDSANSVRQWAAKQLQKQI